MRQIVVVQTGTGSTAAIPLDTYQAPFQVSIGLAISGDADCEIQHTYDNVQDPAITPTWFPTASAQGATSNLLQENGDLLLQENSSTILTGSESFAVYIDYPVSAVRLNTAANTGSITMTVLQAGMPGR